MSVLTALLPQNILRLGQADKWLAEINVKNISEEAVAKPKVADGNGQQSITTPQATPLVRPQCILRTTGDVSSTAANIITLCNASNAQAEVIVDYGRCEGGIPVFDISASTCAQSHDITFSVTYSETLREADIDRGDGPFLLFSNAMDTYRTTQHSVSVGLRPQTITARHAQRSQRYQRIRLLTPNCSVTFDRIGMQQVRPAVSPLSTFHCPNEKLNQIWEIGARTIDMCTVDAGETDPAWDVTSEGSVVYGQHWAPVRQGTRWGDKTVTFDVRIDKGGASWGVHMVVNGLVFCLDPSTRNLTAHEGLSHESSVFPATLRGSWTVGSSISLNGWIVMQTVASGDTVKVSINGNPVAAVDSLNIHPILGGSANNTGSVAFGGPEGWKATFRNLTVEGPDGNTLYSNSLLPSDQARTFDDFAVGTNNLACTIDGAKRDRSVFGGDLFISGRSIAYSTAKFEAIRGSIDLLTSHQTKDGYLGALCPIQAPVHREKDVEPPTYAFYSMAYALYLVAAIKEYWMQTGDAAVITETWPALLRLVAFVEGFQNEDGLVAAPPPLSLTFFPLGGPIFGVSTEINLAFYDALQSMARMSQLPSDATPLLAKAANLKAALLQHLYSPTTGILRMSATSPTDGLSQHVNAYAMHLGISPSHPLDKTNLLQPTTSTTLPSAWTSIPHWTDLNLCSPYSTSFAAEACFTRNLGPSAIALIERVWGPMIDRSNPDYSGCTWEAMTLDGKPYHDSTSLVHAWSTAPVYLLPMYLAGLRPTEPGWREWEARPCLAGVERVGAGVQTVSGRVEVEWSFGEEAWVEVVCPEGTVGKVVAPEGWAVLVGEVGEGKVLGEVKVPEGRTRYELRRVARDVLC